MNVVLFYFGNFSILASFISITHSSAYVDKAILFWYLVVAEANSLFSMVKSLTRFQQLSCPSTTSKTHAKIPVRDYRGMCLKQGS